jgi:hypothetical protein
MNDFTVILTTLYTSSIYNYFCIFNMCNYVIISIAKNSSVETDLNYLK